MSAPVHSRDLTTDWAGFCNLWRHIGAHASVYGWAPDFRRAGAFLSDGGFMAAATRPACGLPVHDQYDEIDCCQRPKGHRGSCMGRR